MTESYSRPGKHTVHVGDLVHVAGSDSGRGWYNAEVLRFSGEDPVIAAVTRPGSVGVRHVAAERLTRQTGPR